MQERKNYYLQALLKHDLRAGLSVFLVALPLCLGIALASGAPLYAGLLSGIIGGLVVSLISGSQLGVSGPAAGLSTVVAASIISCGDYRIFLLCVVIAGIFQLILGLLRLGAIAGYFPSSVIKGMLAAIGLILIFKQIPVTIGYDRPDFWGDAFRYIFFSNNIQDWANAHISVGAITITCFSLFLVVFLKLPVMRSFSKIPLALVLVLAGAILNGMFVFSKSMFSLTETQLVNVPADVFHNILFPDFKMLFSSANIWKDGLLIGLLATLESLLSVEAVDKLDKHNRITPVNRELVAQGIGNITCGLLGAIPITAVIVRGSANVDAGGKTKLSAFMHGVFLLISIVTIPFLLNMIPYASLACILLVTGYNLTKIALYKNMWNLGLKQFIPFIVTILSILLTDLLIGVSIGLLFAIYFIVQNNFNADYKISITNNLGISRYLIKLNSNITFLNKVNLRRALDQVPEYSELIIDGSESNFIDHDILEIISEFNNKAHDRHIDVQLKGIKKVSVTSSH